MQEITKTRGLRPPAIPNYVWIGFAVLTVFVYFYGLTLPFLGPDEARYAQVGREMLVRGDWVTPTLGGFNWFEKPALLYWLEICSYKVFGVNEFAARVGPALFGLGTVASLWVLGTVTDIAATRSAIKGGPQNNSFANWLAIIAASTLGLVVFARGASFDIIITFPITASLVSFYIFERSETGPFRSKYLPLISFYFFIGVALLAKGLIGIVFPFAIVGFYYILSWKIPNRAFLISVGWGTLLAISVALVWYGPVYARNGYTFIEEFFIEHHFQRFTSNKFQHPQPFYFFLWVLPLMTLPWLPFFLAAVWKCIKGPIKTKGVDDQEKADKPAFHSSPIVLFSASWILVPLVFFSFSGSKLPGYILPAVPGAIVLTGVFMADLIAKSRRWRNAILLTAASMLTATFLLLTFAVPRFAESDSVRSLFRTAAEHGYVTNRVINLHTISYNAEFYAAGRILRDNVGKPRRLSGVGEVITELRNGNDAAVLVLIPLEYISQLTREDKINSEILKDNGELAIAAVSIK